MRFTSLFLIESVPEYLATRVTSVLRRRDGPQLLRLGRQARARACDEDQTVSDVHGKCMNDVTYFRVIFVLRGHP